MPSPGGHGYDKAMRIDKQAKRHMLADASIGDHITRAERLESQTLILVSKCPSSDERTMALAGSYPSGSPPPLIRSDHGLHSRIKPGLTPGLFRGAFLLLTFAVDIFTIWAAKRDDRRTPSVMTDL